MEGFNRETNQFADTINIKEYIALFWQWAWAIALVTIIGGAIGYFVSYRTTPVYQASTVVLVNEAPATRSADYTSLVVAERLSQTYAEMMLYPPVLDETILRLGLTMSSDKLLSMISANPKSNTQLMEVIVQSTDPVEAATIANTLVEVFSEQIEAIESNRFGQSKQTLSEQLSGVQEEIDRYTSLAVTASKELERFAQSKRTLEEQLSSLQEEIDEYQEEIDANQEEIDNYTGYGYATATPADLEAEIAEFETGLAQAQGMYSSILKSYEEVELAAAAYEVETNEHETKITQYQNMYSSILQSYEEVRLSEAQSSSSIVQMKPAVRPDSPISPNILRTAALGAAVGLMLSIGVIVAVEMLDDTLKTPEDITRHLGLPVLGMIDRYSEHEANCLITQQQPRNPTSESFRALRTNAQFASVDHQLQTVLVTSPGPSEGKSTIAANLAVVFAQSGKSTFLFDCDFRRPALHKYFRRKNRTGLSGLLYQSNYQFDRSYQVYQVNETQNLSLLTTGPLPPNPAELLASEKMKTLFSEIKKQYDTIIIDSPPILAVTDAAILAPMVDGVLLVIQPGKTQISAAQQTVEQLMRANAKILGVVINALDLKRSRYAYRYGYHYYGRGKYSRDYYASEEQEQPKKKLLNKKRK